MQRTSAPTQLIERHEGNNARRPHGVGETASADQGFATRARFGRLTSVTVAMREVISVLERVAPSDLAVLIEGETGTGKSLVADAIHQASARANGPFVVLDCAATTRDLFPGELASAAGGTLYLDDVTELPMELQARLLRALESPDRSAAADVRVVASTTRSLSAAVNEGRFRRDLGCRLSTVLVCLTPLRSRIDDLPLLAAAILDDLNDRRRAQGLPGYPALDARAMSLLARHDFPGNVRELRNFVECIAVLGADVACRVQKEVPAADAGSHQIRTDLPFHDAKEIWNEVFERTYLTGLLANNTGNVSATARDAGIDRRHLQRLMIRHELRDRNV